MGRNIGGYESGDADPESFKPPRSGPAPGVVGRTMSYRDEIMGDWAFDDRLRQLAEEYHLRCDGYDRFICGNKEGRPTTGYQMRLVNWHAKQVLKELEQRQREEDIVGNLLDTIRKMSR